MSWRPVLPPRPRGVSPGTGQALRPGATRWRRRAEPRAQPGKRWQRQSPKGWPPDPHPFAWTGHGIQAERTAGPNLTSLPPLDPRLPTLGRALPVRSTRLHAGQTLRELPRRAAAPAQRTWRVPGRLVLRFRLRARRTQTERPVPAPIERGPGGMEVGVGSDSEVLTAWTSGPLHPRLPLPGLHRLRASLNAANPLPYHPNASLKD